MSVTCELFQLDEAKIAECLAIPDQLMVDLEEGIWEEADRATLGEAWHIIHFLLTGTENFSDWPLGFLFSGGEVIEEAIVGYEPVRILQPEQVKEVDATLSKMDTQKLFAQHGSQAMLEAEELYPDHWKAFQKVYFIQAFETLRNFMQAATLRQNGILIVYI
ncbi:MAG: YfbM family protein [Anaerolineae bacterium]|nr:YfbM family protein [Gloeobacterales cyanobacterium ES-bin-313]